jgi:hypothetical protein
VSQEKGFTRRAQKVSFQRLPWRKSDRVQHEVNSVGVVPNMLEKLCDLRIAGYITTVQGYVRPKSRDQIFDVLFQALALIIEN